MIFKVHMCYVKVFTLQNIIVEGTLSCSLIAFLVLLLLPLRIKTLVQDINFFGWLIFVYLSRYVHREANFVAYSFTNSSYSLSSAALRNSSLSLFASTIFF